MDKSRALGRLKYLRRKNAGSLTVDDLINVYERNKYRNNGVLVCYLCGKVIKGESGNIEHKTPIIRGGFNVMENLDIAHGACNKSKGAKTYEEFLLDRSKL